MPVGIGLKIRIARTEKNLTQTQLAKLLGTSHPVIANWEAGKYIPKHESLLKLCKALEKPMTYFMGEPTDPNPEGLKTDGFQFVTDTLTIPILARVHAGEPAYDESDTIAHISIPRHMFPGAMIGILVAGNCMSPTYNAGDYLMLKRQTEPINNKVVVALTDEGYAIRRIAKVGDAWELRCDNPEHKAIRPKKLLIKFQVIGRLGCE